MRLKNLLDLCMHWLHKTYGGRFPADKIFILYFHFTWFQCLLVHSDYVCDSYGTLKCTQQNEMYSGDEKWFPNEYFIVLLKWTISVRRENTRTYCLLWWSFSSLNEFFFFEFIPKYKTIKMLVFMHTLEMQSSLNWYVFIVFNLYVFVLRFKYMET